MLAGILDIDLVGSFIPTAGDSFDILDWGSRGGTFSLLDLPRLATGFVWNTSQLYSNGVISVANAALPGDYSNNGIVDTADYVMWRKNLGQSVLIPNDTTPGAVTAADYDVWRVHFGQLPGSGSGASATAAVSEPATLVLIILAAAGWCFQRRRTT
jgi:hypothetical protein